MADRGAALDEVNAETAERLFVPGLRLVGIEGISVRRAVAELERQPGVRYAEPNFIHHFGAPPNDIYFGSQWALNNFGQGVDSPPVFGTPDADIDAVEAWDVNRGSPSVIVGIADTGVFYNHPDLAPNIYANPGETGGGKETNGVDDDHNGYVDDFRGYDFLANDNDPAPASPPAGLDNHGTVVAGAAGAQGDNSIGLTGVSQETSLLPLRVGPGPSGGLVVADVINAFAYAGRLGAKVVNLSAGGPTFSQGELDAIRGAANTLFVFAAMNDGANNDNPSTPIYPCNLNEPNVVCVAATDMDDKLAGFSNFGPGTVDLAAPGVRLLTTDIGTDPGSSYTFTGGTSLASPITAGAAAVYRSLYPQATKADTRKALREGVDKKPALNNLVETGGRLNLAATLAIAPPPLTLDLGAKKQELKKKLKFFATASADSALVATGKAIKNTAKQLAANQKTKVKAKLKRAKRKRLAKKLDKSGKAKAKVKATATGQSGATAADEVKVKLKD
jgi:subtilisin family serine protease